MKKVMIAAMALCALYSCKPAMERWVGNRINTKEDYIMAEAKKGKIDTAGVEQLLRMYEDFAASYPDNPKSVDYLYKAADFYRSMDKPLKSITIYQRIYENYPKSDKRAYALFLQGFIFENQVHNMDNARLKYTQFLREYPDNPMARDVQITLMNLGKTPEEMVAEFETMSHKIDTVRVSR